jgi:hypothetical protein
MCNFPGKLIAWLDRELPEAEAADVEGHVKDCAECHAQISRYEQTGQLFDAYCAALLESKSRRRIPGWVPLVAGAAAVATLGLLLGFVPGPAEKLPTRTPMAITPAPAVFKTALDLTQVKQHRSGVAAVQAAERRPQQRDEQWIASEPAIQIAIPGDAMFPPGALPEGISFVAELIVAADGSPERIHLQP